MINSVPKNIVAISDALKGRLEAAVNIAAGGGTQIIFFVVPTLIIAGIVLGKPFALIFTVFELVSVFFASIIFNLVVRDGKSNWFEGVMLLGVYGIIAAGYYVI